MNVLKEIKSFSPDEQNFFHDETISAEKTSEEWISFFRKALLFDKHADSKRKKLMTWAILPLFLIPIVIFVVFMLLAIIIGATVPEGSPYEGIVFFMTMIILLFSGVPILAFCIYKFVQYFKLRKFNVKCNHEIRSKVLPVLTLLREEVSPQQKIKLSLDLTKTMVRKKLVNQSPSYSKGPYHDIVDYDYKNNWMNGKTTFTDGTLLKWSISSLAREQVKTKRNFRGKYKTKTKYKYKTFISLQAGLQRKKFLLPPKLKQKGEEGAIRTKKQGKYDWIQIKRTFKHDTNQFHIQYLIDTIASVYMRAKPNLMK